MRVIVNNKSRHNKYRVDIANMNIRVRQEVRRKVEVKATARGETIVDFIRHAIDDAVKDVMLTSEDYAVITERIKENEKRQARKDTSI